MSIRPVSDRDVPELVELMRGLARYEKLPQPDGSAARRIRAALKRGEPRLHGLIAREGRKAVGYALYFYTFSTFLARPTFYLEDLFVLPECRGGGHGRRLLEKCVSIGKRKGCARMEWVVLDWNKPAQKFYKKSGARWLKEWMTYRLTLRKGAW